MTNFQSNPIEESFEWVLGKKTYEVIRLDVDRYKIYDHSNVQPKVIFLDNADIENVIKGDRALAAFSWKHE